MKARIPPVLLVLVALLAPACGGLRALPRTVPEAERLTEDQRRAYLGALADAAGGRRARALDHLEELAALRPLHVPTHLLRQDLLRAEDRGEELPGVYGALAAEPGASADAEVLRVRVSSMDPTERVAAYQAAAVRDAASPWPRVALAVARMVRSRDFEARSRERALRGFVGEARALHEEALAAADRSCTEAERAVALAPDLAASHAALARSLASAAAMGKGTPEEVRDLRGRALKACDRALELDPGDPRVLLERALLYRDSRRMDESLRDLEAAAAAAPMDREILAERAQAFESVGRTEEALDAWEAVLDLAPDWADAWMDGGNASLRAGRFREAIRRYRRAETLYAAEGEERWKPLRGLATTLAQMGLDDGDPERLAQALVQVRAYAEAGGPDRAWVENMTYFLSGEETPAPAPGGPAEGGRP